jgi:2',3'-cyclic-nucleotide 2'-phosphodiesterase (5'-nucleotidase family)
MRNSRGGVAMIRARKAASLLFAIVLAGCSSPPGEGEAAARPAADSLHLRVIATHDFHGALTSAVHAWSGGRRVGGAAELKAVMDQAEASCACPTVRLDGGDQMQGSLESNLVFGRSVVRAFNLLGLDAAAVGNHELDWSVDTLLVRQAEAGYPWLAANVFVAATGERPEWAHPFAMVERDGVRVGVVGYLTVGTPDALLPEVTAPYEFRLGYAPMRDALEAVSRFEPDFTVIVAHAGGHCDGETCSGEMVDLARELPEGSVQLIVGGHDHLPGRGVVNGIPIVRAGSHARAVMVVDLVRHPDGRRSFQIERRPVLADEVEPDPAMLALLAPYRLRADSVGQAHVAMLAEPLGGGGGRRLGGLVAESLRLAAAADFGLYNPGGVRAGLEAGKVTYADLYRVLPFEDQVVRVELTGRELREVVEHAFSRRVYHFASLRVEYDPGAPPGRRIVALATADGRPVADDARYVLATVEYLAGGGDGFAMLGGRPAEPTGVPALEAVIRHLQSFPLPVALPREEWLQEVVR